MQNILPCRNMDKRPIQQNMEEILNTYLVHENILFRVVSIDKAVAISHVKPLDRPGYFRG